MSFYALKTYFICKKWSILHSPNLPTLQIRQICKTLAKLTFRESGESSVNGLANVSTSGESSVNRLANVGESGESSVNGLANVGESGESCIFPKMAILASTRTHQKRPIFGKYSNSLNLLASGHSLVLHKAIVSQTISKPLQCRGHHEN